MRKFFYVLLQCTWGFLQTLAGAVLFLFLIRREHFFYHGAVATVWKNKTSASLGMFLFLTEDCSKTVRRQLLVHEYGHTIQSLVLGPLYLPLVGLPSMLWCFLPVCINFRARKKISYYSFFTERCANLLGEKVTGEVAVH